MSHLPIPRALEARHVRGKMARVIRESELLCALTRLMVQGREEASL